MAYFCCKAAANQGPRVDQAAKPNHVFPLFVVAYDDWSQERCT
jgi:hypothetical protein